MKKILFSFIILSILLAACAPQSVPTAIAQATTTAEAPTPTAPVPTVVATPTAAPAPTEAPTIAPTATENPLAGAPDGATGKDPVSKEWTKPNPERPDKPFYYKDRMIGNEHLQGWYWEAGSAPLTDGAVYGTASQVHIWCEEGAGCPQITHPANYVDNGTSASFSALMYTQIGSRVLGVVPPHGTQEQWNAFDEQYRNNQVEIPFTTASGENHVYKIRPDTSMNIFISAKPLTNPDFSSKTYSLQGSTSGDDQGNVYVVEHYTGTDGVASLPPLGFTAYLLHYPFVILATGDLSQASVLKTISNPAFASVFMLATKGQNPYFIMSH